MTVFVFTGPTLSPDEARAELTALYLPPVAQGDVYRAALRRPRAIGIIDGYFERVPAVWHKEILWAMSHGIHVYGSASMGALRAAELAAFGMEGVGAVFEAYRDGTLEDDDEVAVAHGPQETGYRAISVAMVDIRSTLAAAEAAGVINSPTRAALERVAKNLFYPDRGWSLILERAVAEGVPEPERRGLRDWLPRGRVDQKRNDALAMLTAMRERLEADAEPKRVRYSFEYTELWEHARRLAGTLPLRPGEGPMVLPDMLLDELRLERDAYALARPVGLLRYLAVEEAWRHGKVVTPEVRKATVEAFCRERGLGTMADVERWLEKHQLDQEEFTRLMEDEARLKWVEAHAQPEVAGHLLDHLRVCGEYGRLLARARDKQQRLDACGLDNPGLAECGLTHDELLRWYFETRLGLEMTTDVTRYASAAGFEDEDAFRRAILREFCYLVRSGVTTT